MYCFNSLITYIVVTASRYKSISRKLGKPSSSVPKREYSKAFSPLDGSVVAKQKQQRKAIRTNPHKITNTDLSNSSSF